jgi:predicted Zn-dependent protease
MTEQTPIEYHESRRRFLRNMGLAGIGMMAVPLLLAPKADAGGLFAAPSPTDQQKVGDKAAQKILQKYKEVHDGRARHFDQLGQRLVSALSLDDRKTWNFRFHVLDSKAVNAFALPGGNMFMYTGLYEKLTTDDALAAVTGHEMTHVRKQHWAQAYAKREQRETLLALGLSIFHASDATQSLVGLADGVLTLKYSRSAEAQADAGGLRNMVDADYNPEGMIQLFQILQQVSGNGGSVAGDFLSDHPLTSDRIKAAQKQIDQLDRDHRFPALTPLDYSRLA